MKGGEDDKMAADQSLERVSFIHQDVSEYFTSSLI